MFEVMLVDDEANVLNALKRELSFLVKASDSAFQIRLHTFTEPVQALAHAFENPVDLVVSDYRMPEMNGVEMLRSLKQIRPDAASIILSGQADMTAVLRAINEVGIARFISKPWEREALLTHLLEVMSDLALRRENRRLADEMRDLMGQDRLNDGESGVEHIEA